MRRREFIRLFSSTVVAWPLAAHAQRADQVRRIGVLMNSSSTDPEGQALLAEFTRSLAEFGWTEGRNVRIDVRWGASDVDPLHTFAKELIGLQPDVLLASSTPVTAALARETQTIPIVFTSPGWDRLATKRELIGSATNAGHGLLVREFKRAC